MIIWQCDKKQLQKEFADDIESILAPSIYTWYVTSGYRPEAEQEILYHKYLNGGPLAAKPGQSAHNYHLAVDLAVDGDMTIKGLQMIWNLTRKVIGMDPKLTPPWKWLVETVKKHPRLHSGVGFGDLDHVERYNWRNYR